MGNNKHIPVFRILRPEFAPPGESITLEVERLSWPIWKKNEEACLLARALFFGGHRMTIKFMIDEFQRLENEERSGNLSLRGDMKFSERFKNEKTD